MKWLLLLATVVPFQLLSDLPLTSLGFDAAELKSSFNKAANQTRMVIVFSPT